MRDLVEAVCVVVLEQLQESTNSRLGLPAYTIMTVSPIGNSICVAFRQQNIDPNRIFVWVIEFPPMPQNLWSAEAIITENFLEDMLELTFRTWREQKKLFFLG
ncbi:hypothetical protein [Sulfobacillus thermosulfidooxidans]|uniref:hypothetical protein n=1 Tax=Sulfobacillus thermosulfidooxidans TaxID=28034 RepID=UPI0006B58AC8|nr:hypothetical protein [Sulfobacillus thermosulfidooxidans]